MSHPIPEQLQLPPRRRYHDHFSEQFLNENGEEYTVFYSDLKISDHLPIRRRTEVNVVALQTWINNLMLGDTYYRQRKLYRVDLA